MHQIKLELTASNASIVTTRVAQTPRRVWGPGEAGAFFGVKQFSVVLSK